MPKRHGDIALVQHMSAFQTDSLIGRDYGGVSDAHNMVVVVAKTYGEKRHRDAGAITEDAQDKPRKQLRDKSMQQR